MPPPQTIVTCFPVSGVAIFLLINYLVFLLLRLICGRTWLALLAIILSYYFLIRKIVTYVIFPGCFPLFRRKLEVQYQESMGKHILDQLREFSLCVDMFKSGQADDGMDDYSRS